MSNSYRQKFWFACWLWFSPKELHPNIFLSLRYNYKGIHSFYQKKCISVRKKNPQLNKKFDKLSEILVLIKIISKTKFITASYKYECVYVYVSTCEWVSVRVCVCVRENIGFQCSISPLVPGRLSSNRLMSLFTGNETWCCFT